MNIFLNIVARTMYRKIVSASHAKYSAGKACSFSQSASHGINGIAVKTAIPVNVSKVTEADARLLINGSFGVRIM